MLKTKETTRGGVVVDTSWWSMVKIVFFVCSAIAAGCLAGWILLF